MTSPLENIAQMYTSPNAKPQQLRRLPPAAACIAAAVVGNLFVLGASVANVIAVCPFYSVSLLVVRIAWNVSLMALLIWAARHVTRSSDLLAAMFITGLLGVGGLLAGIVGIVMRLPVAVVCVMFVYGVPLSAAALLIAVQLWGRKKHGQSRQQHEGIQA